MLPMGDELPFGFTCKSRRIVLSECSVVDRNVANSVFPDFCLWVGLVSPWDSQKSQLLFTSSHQ